MSLPSRSSSYAIRKQSYEEIFSPLEADLSLQTTFPKFDETSELTFLSPAPILDSFDEETSNQGVEMPSVPRRYSPFPPPPRRLSIPRKSISGIQDTQRPYSHLYDTIPEPSHISQQRASSLGAQAVQRPYPQPYDTIYEASSQSLHHQHTNSFDTQYSKCDTIEEEKEEVVVTKRGWRFYGTFFCLAIVNLVCALDATILSVALPTIATSLKGTTAIEAFWAGTSFLLCSTVFQPSWASFSHIIGRKSVLLTALMLFTLGSIICSIASKISVLLAGRCVQGIGGGGLVSLTYVILADMVTLRDRGKWMSIISLMWAVGSVLGPVVGGAFAEHDWHWIFYLNFPFCAIAAIGIPICLRLNQKPGDLWEKLRKFDWLGSVMFVGATTSFLIPLTWGGLMYEWSSWRTLVPLLVGTFGLVIFVMYSVYISTEPLIRHSLFNSSTAISAYFGTLIQGLLVWSILYYMPLYFEVAKGYSPVQSGIAIFPFTFTTAPAAVVTGLIITKTGRYRPVLWVGWFLSTLGMGLLIFLKVDTNTPSWIFLSLVAGTGLGILFSAMGFTAQSSVSNADLPFAGAIYSFFRAFGQTIGVAISGVIFQNTIKKKLLRTAYAMYADEWSNDATAFVQVVKTWSTTGDEGVMRKVVIQAYIESLQMVWIVMCILCGVAFLASLIWTKEISLNRELETEQGFRYDVKRADTWKSEDVMSPMSTKSSKSFSKSTKKGKIYNAKDIDALLSNKTFVVEEV